MNVRSLCHVATGNIRDNADQKQDAVIPPARALSIANNLLVPSLQRRLEYVAGKIPKLLAQVLANIDLHSLALRLSISSTCSLIVTCGMCVSSGGRDGVRFRSHETAATESITFANGLRAASSIFARLIAAVNFVRLSPPAVPVVPKINHPL